MRYTLLFSTIVLSLFRCSMVTAQNLDVVPADANEGADVEEFGIELGNEKVTHWKVGVIVTASRGPVKGIICTIPEPTEWPEQTVKLVSKDVSRGIRIKHRDLKGVKQLIVNIPSLGNGKQAKALFTYEIARKPIAGTKGDTEKYVIPKKLARADKRWLGSSPYVSTRDSRVKKLSRETLKEIKDESAWEKVEALYDVVREKVEYKEGKIKTAAQALRDGEGDCEELTSLFIALCRINKVPARMVWVPDHCYPEFYLEDANGKGHWFPCQAAGTRAFGDMPELRPILQKGDNFKVPEKSKPQRYVAEFMTGKPARKGGGPPDHQFVRELTQPGLDN